MDAVTLAVAAVQTAAALALLFLLPGLTLGPAIAPGAMSPAARLGRAAGVSLVTTAVASAGLAALGLLRPTILLATLIGLTILPLHSRLPRRPGLPRGRAGRWWAGVGVAAVVAIALADVPGWIATAASGTVPAPAWEDVTLAQAVVAQGGLPDEVAAWGAGRPFTTTHLLPVVHLAAALELLPGDLMVRLEAARLAILAAGLLTAILLLRRWFSTWTALLGGILLLGTVAFNDAFRAWSPLAWALVVALFGLWLVDRALVERTRRAAAAAAVAGGAVLLAHPAGFLVWLAAVAGIAVGRALVAPGGGPETAGGLGHRYGRRLGLRRRLERSVLVPVGIAAAIGAGGVAVGLLGDLLLTGEPGIAGHFTGRPAGNPGDVFTRIAELPPGWRATDDATWDLHIAAFDAAAFGEAPPEALDAGGAAAVLRAWPRVDARTPLGLLVLIAALVAAVASWLIDDARRQRAILGTAVFAVALGVGTLLAVAVADSFAGREVAVRRLLPFEQIVPVVAVVLALWLLEQRLVPRFRRLRPLREAGAAKGLALVVLAGLLAVPILPSVPPVPGPGARVFDPSPTAIEAYRWIGDNLPDDARLLVAAYTPGTVATLSGHVGIIDGPVFAPRQPGWPTELTALLLGARRLFLEPDGPGAAAYVDREQVDHLLVPGTSGTGADLGGHEPFAVDLDALAASNRYELVRTFGDGRLLLFEVTRP